METRRNCHLLISSPLSKSRLGGYQKSSFVNYPRPIPPDGDFTRTDQGIELPQNSPLCNLKTFIPDCRSPNPPRFKIGVSVVIDIDLSGQDSIDAFNPRVPASPSTARFQACADTNGRIAPSERPHRRSRRSGNRRVPMTDRHSAWESRLGSDRKESRDREVCAITKRNWPTPV